MLQSLAYANVYCNQREFRHRSVLERMLRGLGGQTCVHKHIDSVFETRCKRWHDFSQDFSRNGLAYLGVSGGLEGLIEGKM